MPNEYDKYVIILLLIATLFVIMALPILYDPNFIVDIIIGLGR